MKRQEKVHLVTGRGSIVKPLCGQRGPGQRGQLTATRHIELVTCKKCLKIHREGDGPQALKDLFRW